MGEVFIGSDYGMALLLPLLWLPAALGVMIVRRVANRTHGRWWVRGVQAILGLALLATATRIMTVTLLGTLGWWFVMDTVLIAVPLVVVPALVTLRTTLPALRSIATGLTTPAPGDDVRATLLTPQAVVPMQAAAWGACLGMALAHVQPVPPLVLPALVYGSLFALFVGWRSFVEARPKPRLWVRLARSAALLVWMNHCHNQEHAAIGMSMHLLYEGVTTPFEAGRATRNQPE